MTDIGHPANMLANDNKYLGHSDKCLVICRSALQKTPHNTCERHQKYFNPHHFLAWSEIWENSGNYQITQPHKSLVTWTSTIHVVWCQKPHKHSIYTVKCSIHTTSTHIIKIQQCKCVYIQMYFACSMKMLKVNRMVFQQPYMCVVNNTPIGSCEDTISVMFPAYCQSQPMRD